MPNTINYVYQYKDHLGNIRLSYSDTDGDGHIDVEEKNQDDDHDGVFGENEIVEEDNYYPFGLKHKGYGPIVSAHSNDVAKKFKYNGQELQDELGLNLYSMDMRQYDPAIARWTSIDPVIHHSMSTYNAFDNNPVFWADPSGADGCSFWQSSFMNRNGGHWTDQFRKCNKTENGEQENEEPPITINYNNPQTIKGAHLRISGNVMIGLGKRAGEKGFGVGEQYEFIVGVKPIEAELLWSLDTGFILNINFTKSMQEFLNLDPIYSLGYSNTFGLGTSGRYSRESGIITDVEGTINEGPFTLNFSSDTPKGDHGISILSGSKTVIEVFSFSGSISIEGLGETEGGYGIPTRGSAVNGFGIARNQLRVDAERRKLRLRNNQQHDLRSKFIQTLKKIK